MRRNLMNNSSHWDLVLGIAEEDPESVCVIIGNGPSLKSVPNSFLEKYTTFGSNRIYLKAGFTPTYYVAVNPLVIEQCLDDIAEMDCSGKFIASDYADRVPGSFPLFSKPIPHFSMHPGVGIYEGHTVTYVAQQIAFFMGYKTALLVGVDHRYEFTGAPNQEVISLGNDPNHFHDGYFGEGFRWHNPDLAMSERAYRMARTAFEARGRRIINLTQDSALEVFERQSLEEWL